MAVELCVLASGSGGNCSALRTPGGVVLIDAGLGPRATAQRLAGAGAARDVAAVCLTHLDRDHFNPNWSATLARKGVPIFCHAVKVSELRTLAAAHGASPEVRPFDDDLFEPVPGLAFRPISLAHDAAGSHGFVIDGFGCRVGYATDLGRVTDELLDLWCATGGLDLLAIESNYDPRMQADSPRPFFLKRRITGGRGHLSNQQAFDAVRRVFNTCEAAGGRLPAHVVLLHRSRQCNCPDVLRRLFARDVRMGPRLVLAEQHERTDWLYARPRALPLVGRQMELAWG